MAADVAKDPQIDEKSPGDTATARAPRGALTLPPPATVHAPAVAFVRGRGPKPPVDVPWRHQDGCMNPDSEEWNCACGPEVIPA